MVVLNTCLLEWTWRYWVSPRENLSHFSNIDGLKRGRYWVLFWQYFLRKIQIFNVFNQNVTFFSFFFSNHEIGNVIVHLLNLCVLELYRELWYLGSEKDGLWFWKATFVVAWVVKRKNINVYVLSLGEPGSVLSLAKLNFTLRCFMFSKTQNIFWELLSPLSLFLWEFYAVFLFLVHFQYFMRNFWYPRDLLLWTWKFCFANIKLYSSPESLSSV